MITRDARPTGTAPGSAPADAPWPTNPYILTPLTEGVGFYGREAVLQFVRNTLSTPYQNVVVLYGQRRIGKTSLLYQFMRSGQTPAGFRAAYFDLQGRAETRLSHVLYGLAREIARALAIPAPPREAFAEETYFQYMFLPAVYKALGDERLLILIDEFDVLGSEEVLPSAAYHTLFNYIQDLLIDEPWHLKFVFVVGRRLDELPSRIKATFKSAQCKRITVLDRESAERLIREPAAGRLAFSDTAVNALLELTNGHPYFLQLLCYELFERCSRGGRATVTAADVTDDVLAAAMELGMGGLSWFWDEFPPAERFILAAIAHITQSHTRRTASLRQIGDTLRAHGVQLQGMELSTAPKVLVEWEIVERTGRDNYRFRVEFLRRWILARHSLDEAKRELEQISARAVLLYESARRQHRAGELDAAIAEYRRALAANPNHSRAQLGLAQVLYETGRLEAATEAFDRAYRLDPESARDGLIAAHRDVGTTLVNEGRFDRARAHFQRVLDVSPADAGARVNLRDCWRATAGTHLATGRWDKAVEAYREALRYVPDDEYLIQALSTLEQRHVEAEAIQRRRQQIERAVLEARLRDEQGRREEIEANGNRALTVLLAVAMTMCLGGVLAIAAATRTLHSPTWALVAGASVIALYATYAWSTRKLGG